MSGMRPAAVNRLPNMGVEPFLVAACLSLVLAQRLLRRVCSKCKLEVEPRPYFLRELGVKPEEIGTFPVYEAPGCDVCHNTGYKGRVGVFEVMSITEEIRRAILEGASAEEIKRRAMSEGMDTLFFGQQPSSMPGRGDQ